MLLFSGPVDAASHALRFALAEKGLLPAIIDVEPPDVPEDLLDINPFGSVPTLVDRELVLYEPVVALEYLDERHPHPPLGPQEPAGRAQLRQAALRLGRDWYTPLAVLEGRADRREREAARTRLREGVIAGAELFRPSGYFLTESFTLLDCLVVPVLWRLGRHGIELPSDLPGVRRYLAKVAARPAFLRSLTAREKEFSQAS
jgi:stringent starvation protein A